MYSYFSSDTVSSWANVRVTSRCVWIDSVIWLPTFMTGLSDVMGSWKTMPMCAPQYLRICLGVAAPISTPSNLIDPCRTTFFLGSSPMIERESTVLP